jgi:site-specific recombinase XerC
LHQEIVEQGQLDLMHVQADEIRVKGCKMVAWMGLAMMVSTDALLRVVRAEQNAILRTRDEALLALLIYAGLQVQEACDLQLRDLDVGSGTITVRSGMSNTWYTEQENKGKKRRERHWNPWKNSASRNR